jgi:hypothetical protein
LIGGLYSKLTERLKIDHVWASVALVGVLVFLNLQPIRPHDFWWHMAIGREIVDTGQIPVVDAYSQTQRGMPYPSYSMFWLMEVTFYLIYSLGGPALIVFFHSLTISSAYATLLWLSMKVSGSWRWAALGMLFAAMLGFNDWNVRPQAVTFLLGAIYLQAIHALRGGAGRRWLLVFPAGMLVWVNSHGTFFIGLVIIGLWLAEEVWLGWRARAGKGRWNGLVIPLMAFLGSVLVCLMNPRGIDVISYLIQMFSSSPVQYLASEWAAPSFDTLPGAFFLVGLLFSAAILVVSPKRPSFYQLMIFLLFAALSLKTSRGIVWFGITMAPILAEHFQAISAIFPHRNWQNSISPGVSRRLNGLFVSVILFMGVISLPWFKQYLPLPELKRGLISSETPIHATEFLLEGFYPGPLFHHMPYGSYLIWAAQPDYPVFVDSRIELYPIEQWLDYILISNAGEGWEMVLENYGIKTMLLSLQEQPNIVYAARFSEFWKYVYSDSQSVIYTRDE